MRNIENRCFRWRSGEREGPCHIRYEEREGEREKGGGERERRGGGRGSNIDSNPMAHLLPTASSSSSATTTTTMSTHSKFYVPFLIAGMIFTARSDSYHFPLP